MRADAVNIVLCGHVPASAAAGVKAAAGTLTIPAVVGAICGNEWSGGLGIPALTNYPSQEAPLLTGAVDLLIVGGQCIIPAVVDLANRLGIAVIAAASLQSQADFATAAKQAQAAFRRRAGDPVAIPAATSRVYAGYSAANSARLLAALSAAEAVGLQGLVYLGGCGSVVNTQDAQPTAIADALIDAGYLVVTAGCAGVSLAKAGMCRPDWRNGQYRLRGILPEHMPPVLNVGSCQDAGEFIRLARELAPGGLPLAAVFPEINHHKVLASAFGFAAAGIDAWIGLEPVLADPTAGWLDRAFVSQAGARLQPLPEAADWPQLLRESRTAPEG